LANLYGSASQFIANIADTYLAQSFLYTSNDGTSACASGFGFCNKRGSNAGNVGDDFRTFDEAATVGESGKLDCSSDLVIVAGDELVWSSAGESREGRDDDSGETHVE
jgi:hypothetical protein